MIEILVVIVGIIVVLQCIVAGINVFSRPRKTMAPVCDTLVSVLIPARNEAENIRNLLNDLRKQPYQQLEILVFDDQSTDNTAEIVQSLAAEDRRIRLLCSGGLPEGWLGKNYACHQLSEQAQGDYLLFLDADVRISNQAIPHALKLANYQNSGLLSFFPVQIMNSPGEWATVPLMNHILLTLLPLPLVRKARFASLAAANGQWMLFRKKDYSEHLPHLQVKKHPVEDIAIARYFKQQQVPVSCCMATPDISCRMYHSFGEATNGFAKNILSFFGNSATAALAFWATGIPAAIVVTVQYAGSGLLLYLAITALTRILVSIASYQNPLYNLLLAPVHQAVLLHLVLKAMVRKQKKTLTWKGRKIG